MKKVILLRHGESVWNKENRFTGWTDVDLTAKGVEEAGKAGELMREAGFVFDLAHTSVLRRAIKTLWLALERMDLMWIPVLHSWRLNERHYGALQGLNKAETAAKFGDAAGARLAPQLRYPAARAQPRTIRAIPATTRATAASRPSQVPLTECLKDTVARVLPYWNQTIAPDIRAGKRVLIAAHGNSHARAGEVPGQGERHRISSASIFPPACRWCTNWTTHSSPSATTISAMRPKSKKRCRQSQTRARRRLESGAGDARRLQERHAVPARTAPPLRQRIASGRGADRARPRRMRPTRPIWTRCASRIETLKKNLSGAEENRSEASDALRASERGVSEANRELRNIGAQQRAARADLDRVDEQSRLLEASDRLAAARTRAAAGACAMSRASRIT